MLLLYLLGLLLLPAYTLAQVNFLDLVSQVPACTIKCALPEITTAGCQLSNLSGCICPNNTIQLQLGTCVLKTCNVTEQIASATTLQKLCKGVPQESRSGETKIISLVLIIITFSIVLLRCASRYLVASKFWWDDAAIVAAAVFLIPLAVFSLSFPDDGFGQHFWNVPPWNIIFLRKAYYTSQILYVFVITLAKLSILFFYLRIFPGKSFRKLVWICITWMIVHFFGFLLPVVLQCLPIKAIWDTDIKGKCVDLKALGFAGAAAGILEDFALIILPIPELKNLHLTKKKRSTLIFMFALGSFACVASIIRLKFMVGFGYGTSIDATWDQVDVIIWSEIEAYMAVVCACLITLRGLLVKYFPRLFAAGNSTKSRRQNRPPSWKGKRNSKLAINLGRRNNGVELSSMDDVTTDQKGMWGGTENTVSTFRSKEEETEWGGTDNTESTLRSITASEIKETRP